MEINYVGEHLAWGYAGNFFIVLAFAAALFSAICYWNAHKDFAEQHSWKRLARIGFRAHSAGVLGIIGVLFFILFNHYFEYHYVWQHSNTAMPMQYILSCFWEGQEGSFLLWTFWNMVLGNILIRTAKDWEPTTMAIVALVQVFLGTMLLGAYVGGYQIGSNPFGLLREHPEFINLPFIQSANYLDKLDGRGLNPLLQNYWMTIHPPTLFLGFSSTLIPFAYAIAGIWRRQFREWIKPALPWTFFGVGILGTGVLMGGAWAYEALSFGGFWAWDPVENASLVPWLTMVAGGHVMLINRNKGQSIATGIFLMFITFILILYSTFLTRSGILGESSVHAFTDLGMQKQLLVYLLFFIWLPSALVPMKTNLRNIWIAASILLVVISFIFGFMKVITFLFLVFAVILMLKKITDTLQQEEGIVRQKRVSDALSRGETLKEEKPEEENISSREFWMFVAALVLLISAFQIIFSTSTPVINKFLSGNIAGFFGWLNDTAPNSVFQKLADAKLAPQKDIIGHYNAWQIPFAVIVALLMAIGQFLKYKKTAAGDFWKKIIPAAVVSLIISVATALAMEITNPLLVLLLFASLFAVAANFHYLLKMAKGDLPRVAPSVAHIGFGLVLAGSLISAGKQEFISQNKSSFDLGKDFPNKENILLAKHDTVEMGDYQVSYRGDSASGINIYYIVDYLQKNDEGKLDKLFTLYPFIQTNPRMGNVAEPATKHYLHKDIFTHVTYAKLEDPKEKKNGGWQEPQDYEMRKGDTVFTSNSMVILEGVDKVDKKKYNLNDSDLAVGARLKVLNISNAEYFVTPVYALRGAAVTPIDTFLEASGLQFSLWKINPEQGNETFHIRIREKASNAGEFIILKAIVFPGINILWAGSILMALGSAMAVWARIRKKVRQRAAA